MSEPETTHDNKTVAIRAERNDTIRINGFGKWTVVRRSQPYFGPKLLLNAADMDYDLNVMLTAPGPQSQLQLWWPNRDEPGWRSGWIKGPEVHAELVDTKQYDICQHCGEPIKTAAHDRETLFGLCDI